MAGVGWLFRFAFTQLALSHTAFISYLTQLNEENRKERAVIAEVISAERATWQSRIAEHTSATLDHTEFSKSQTRAIETMSVALDRMNLTLLEAIAILKEMHDAKAKIEALEALVAEYGRKV